MIVGWSPIHNELEILNPSNSVIVERNEFDQGQRNEKCFFSFGLMQL